MKSFTKRLLSVVMASGMLLSMTACGSSGDGSGASTASNSGEKLPNKQVTIIMPWSLAAVRIPLPDRSLPMAKNIWACR